MIVSTLLLSYQVSSYPLYSVQVILGGSDRYISNCSCNTDQARPRTGPGSVEPRLTGRDHTGNTGLGGNQQNLKNCLDLVIARIISDVVRVGGFEAECE